MKIRVAVIEPVGGHGGMNLYDHSLCRGLVEAGVQATLYTCDQTVPLAQPAFPVKRPYRNIYGKSQAWMRGLRYLRGSIQALADARLSGHQIAHFHFFHVGGLELFNVALARAVGLHVVITAHDVEAFKEGLSVPTFVRWVYRAAHRVIAHSQIAKRELTQGLGIPAGKVDVILHGNYIDSVATGITREMARAHFGIPTSKRVILFFGQIKDVKGLDVLLEGFSLAREKDPSLHLLIGGRVWKTDFSKYQDIIDKHSLAPHCTLQIRYIADAEVPYFHRCADLVVLPYLRIYQSGVALLAMSYGNPVLVSDIEGLLEAVSDGDTGFVFRSLDPVHLAQRLGDIFATPDHRAWIAGKGLRAVRDLNDWGLLGEQSRACYLRALNRGTDDARLKSAPSHGMEDMSQTPSRRVSIVIPVYAGEKTLSALMAEIEPLTKAQATPGGNRFILSEVLLVHDCGPNRSDLALEALSAQHPFVQVVWLSRNFGQHAATLAGMASATGDWVVTMDEDGQQNPADIPALLDFALGSSSQVVYAQPTNPPPHGWFRNTMSGMAKSISTRVLGNRAIGRFNSFRLVDGEIGRTLAAYCGNGVYLDVGLFWIAGRVGHCPVELRNEMDRPSSYSVLKLIGHFWRLILTTGTRPLRMITIMGFSSMVLALVVAIYALQAKYYGQVPVQGWTSLLIVVSFFSGSILASLGVIAEYLAVTMGIVMGKPLYVVSTKPTRPAVRP